MTSMRRCEDGERVKSNGERIGLPVLKRRLSKVISGPHSSRGRSDVTIVE